MMYLTDRRMIDALLGDGRLDRASAVLATELLSQGCTLEQALIGTRFLKKDEFVQQLETLGVERGEFALSSDKKRMASPRISLNRLIDDILQKADASSSQEILFTTTKQHTHVLFDRLKQGMSFPKSYYPALVMKLNRWSKSLGWKAKAFHHHHHEGLRLVRAHAKKHPLRMQKGFLDLESREPGLYVFIKPDAFIREQYFQAAEKAFVYHPSIKDEILREALFGGMVLVSVTGRSPHWWGMVESAEIPVHVFTHG